MLKSFSVENFKNFKNKVTLDFSHTRDYDFNKHLIKSNIINKAIIYGFNASGKSNLGFAIMDIQCHLTDNERRDEHYKNYLNLSSEKNYATFTYVFCFGEKEYTYTYKKDANRKLLEESITYNGEGIFYYDYQTNKGSCSVIKDVDLSKRSENISALKYLRNSTFNFSDDNPIKLIVDFANNMLWFRSLRFNEFMGHLPNGDDISRFIIKNNYVKDFEKFLNDCGIKEKLGVIQTQFGEILVSNKDKNPAPFFEITSTGTEAVSLFYYWKVSRFSKIDFLFIDEFDAFYHEKLSEEIAKLINSYDSFQSVLTTHDSYLADNSIFRPDCIFILKDNILKSFSDATNKVLREGHNLRKMYEAGEFDFK